LIQFLKCGLPTGIILLENRKFSADHRDVVLPYCSVRLPLIILSLLFAPHLAADYSAGADWLEQQVDPDGALDSDQALVSGWQASAAGAQALDFLDRNDSSSLTDIRGYLARGTDSTTFRLAKRIIADAPGHSDLATLVSRLRTLQGPDGAFGAGEGYTGTVLDTALALRALAAAEIAPDDPVVAAAADYLLQRQSADGSWAVRDGPAEVFVTAQAMRGLQPSVRRSEVAAALDSGRQWLLGQRAADGSLGEAWRTAAGVLAVAPNAPNKTVYSDTVSALRDAQNSNGSWSGDAFTTALAVQALALSSQPQPNPTLGSIELSVVDAESGVPIEGADLALTGPENRSTTTAADGSATFESLPAGDYALTTAADGYAEKQGRIALDPGEHRKLGRIRMLLQSASETATIRGTVTNADSGESLSGVTIEVTGAAAATATTDADGAFYIDGLAPGQVDVAVRAAGFRDASAQLQLEADTVATLNPSLQPVDETGATVTGTVTDADSGDAVASATVTLSGADTASTTTASDGSYQLQGVTAGDLDVSVSADGYRTASVSVSPDDGQAVTFSPALVDEGGTPPESDTGNIQGSVIDQADSSVIQGATVAVETGNGLQQNLTTDASGNFSATDVASGPLELSVNHPDYLPRTLSLDLSGGVTLDLGSIPLRAGTTAGVSVTGQVVDSLSNQPVANAQVKMAIGQWKRVELKNTYDKPVVVAGPLTHNNDRSLSVRIRNVTSESFEVSMQMPCKNEEAYSGDGSCQASNWQEETLAYMAVEEGAWQLPDGTRIEAHRSEIDSVQFLSGTNGIAPREIEFAHDYQNPPAVLHNVMSFRDPAWVSSTIWGRGYASEPPDTEGLTMALETAEVAETHGSETVGWIAIAPGSGSVNGSDWESGAQRRGKVRGHQNGCYKVADPALGETPFTLVSQISRGGNNGGWSRFCTGGSGTGGIRVHIDEDQVGNRERRHAPEDVAWLTFENGISGDVANAQRGSAPFEVDRATLTQPVIPRRVTSDHQGQVAFTRVGAGQGTMAIAAQDYERQNKPVFLRNQDTDLGGLRLRPEGAFSADPDLVARGVEDINTSNSSRGYQYTGSLTAKWENTGAVPADSAVNIRTFVDLDGNGVYDSTDRVVGTTTVSGPIPVGEAQTTAIDVGGEAPFPGAPVGIDVDAGGDIIESDEDNNATTRGLACRQNPPAVANLAVKRQWKSQGTFQGHEHPSSTGPPAVGQFSDDNGDGKIDSGDVPDLVLPTGAGLNDNRDTMLGVFSGEDGDLIWGYHDRAGVRVSHRTTPAIGDIDGDGQYEIITINFDGDRLLRFEHDGTLTWNVDSGQAPRGSKSASHAPLITNLDQEGHPEIVLANEAFDIKGNRLWSGDGDIGAPTFDKQWGTVPIAADIHPSKGVEVSAGRTLYGADGRTLWHREDLPGDGVTAVGNFDSDERAEIVYVGRGRVVLLEHTGETIWNVDLGTGGSGGPPTVADFDGDDRPEFGVAGAGRYVVFEAHGTVKWSVDSQDFSSRATGSSVFDFDDDGRAEVLYADEDQFRIFEGSTGETLFSIENNSVTKVEYPLVANVDKDAGAEIVLTSNSRNDSGLRVFEAANGQWAPTRSIWNQHSYHIDNINDDGSIPVEEEKSWQTHNSWRLNTFPGRDALDQPDLVASGFELIDNGMGEPASLRMRVGSAGALASEEDIRVTFYDGAPDAGGTELGTTTVDKLRPGAFSDVELDGVDPAALSGDDLYAQIDPGERMIECREDNNRARTPPVTASTLGSIKVGTDASSYTPDEAAQITAEATNQGRFSGQFSATLRVVDPGGATVAEFGRTDLGELDSGATTSVSESWAFADILAGSYTVVAELRDHDGQVVDRAIAGLDLLAAEDGEPLATLRTATDRAVYSPNARVRVDNLAENVTTNGIIEQARLTTVITQPDGSEYDRSTTALGDLAAGAVRQRQLEVALSGVPEGDWTVTARLHDGDDRLMATGSDTFTVELQPANRVQGSVEALHAERTPGEPQTCTDQLSNPLEQPADGLEIRRLVLNLTAGQAVETSTEMIDLAAGGTTQRQRAIDTGGLEEGRYSCALQVNTDAGWRTLGRADFRMKEPPIDIRADVEAGDRGRLLVLLDPADRKWHAHHDWHGPFCSPGPEEQRQWLEERLEAAGWSYTIVTDEDRFREEFYSDGYAVVALFQEAVKIDERVQRELVDAVEEDGLGLVVAGMHDRRNGRVESALGIHSLGRVPHADGVRIFDSPVTPANRLDFAINGHPRLIYPKQAHRTGEYKGGKTGKPQGGHPGHGWFKRSNSAKDASGDHGARTRTGWIKGCDRDRHRGGHQSNPFSKAGEAPDQHNTKQTATGKQGRHGQTKTAGNFFGRFFKPKAALTRYEHGAGRTVAAGFDLLMQGTASGGENDFSRLLLDALEHVHPDQLRSEADSTWPLSIQLHNRGIATPGRVLVTLPAGAQVIDPGPGSINDAGQWVWPWQLSSGASTSADFWVRLPDRTGPVLFEAHVQTGTAPDWQPHRQLDYSLMVQKGDAPGDGGKHHHPWPWPGWLCPLPHGHKNKGGFLR
jgi:hypothetical protein